MSSLVKIILYILLIFNISTSFGVKESSLAALLGTAGVTMGLALQGRTVPTLAGGMMLLLFKPFQVGDYIIVNGQDGSEGTVAKVEICYTTLLSIDNKHIVIPNGTLSNVTITNVTARDQAKAGDQSGDLLQCRYPEGQGYPGRYPHRGSGYKRRRRDGGIRRRAGRKLCDHGLSCLGRYRPLLGSQMEIERRGSRKILIIMELRFLIISWMCISINNMDKGRKLKPFHMAEKLLCGRVF